VDDWPRGFDLIPQTQPDSALATAAGAQNIGRQMIRARTVQAKNSKSSFIHGLYCYRLINVHTREYRTVGTNTDPVFGGGACLKTRTSKVIRV